VRRFVRFAALSGSIAVVAVACGSRTGLRIEELVPGAGADGSTVGPFDVNAPPFPDGTVLPPPNESGVPPIFEGGALDVTTECGLPSECDPADPSYIYRCGQRIYECSSLEECEVTCQGENCGAQCVNPCVDTLGQDTSNGCEFYPVELDTADEVAGACFAVFIINQWKTGEPARIQVERAGVPLALEPFARIPFGQGLNVQYAPYDSTVGLAKDQVVILFLSRDPAALNDPTQNNPRRLASCPPGVTPAVVGDAALHGTGIGTAFHITTDVPVVAYQMLPYGGGSARVTGATLLLPTNVWDTNYLAANAYAAASLITTDRAEPTLAIVAKQDGTHVTLAPTATILAGDGGVEGSPAGVPITYTIDQGQYLQISQLDELTGSPIVSDAPVAVIGGSTLMDIPVTQYQRADGAEQMLPPVKALGSEYVAVRYRTRSPGTEEFVPWRLVGAVDGTILTYDPGVPIGAPTSLSARQLVEFQATGPFVVRSQDAAHPFYFASYMTGGDPFDGIGDPEFVNVVPTGQYLPEYTFFTDPTYPETNLIAIRERDAVTGLMPDVKLDCAGLLTGWAAVDLEDRLEFARIDLSTGDFVGQNGCDNGVHTIVGSLPGAGASSVAAFGLTVWGWGNDVTWPPDDETNPLFTRWVSYGYPAGANFKQLNDVVIPAE
jgi:hypothetical protein